MSLQLALALGLPGPAFALRASVEGREGKIAAGLEDRRQVEKSSVPEAAPTAKRRGGRRGSSVATVQGLNRMFVGVFAHMVTTHRVVLPAPWRPAFRDGLYVRQLQGRQGWRYLELYPTGFDEKAIQPGETWSGPITFGGNGRITLSQDGVGTQGPAEWAGFDGEEDQAIFRGVNGHVELMTMEAYNALYPPEAIPLTAEQFSKQFGAEHSRASLAAGSRDLLVLRKVVEPPTDDPPQFPWTVHLYYTDEDVGIALREQAQLQRVAGVQFAIQALPLYGPVYRPGLVIGEHPRKDLGAMITVKLPVTPSSLAETAGPHFSATEAIETVDLTTLAAAAYYPNLLSTGEPWQGLSAEEQWRYLRSQVLRAYTFQYTNREKARAEQVLIFV